MAFDRSQVGQTVSEFYGNLPHPQAPELKVREFDVYARVAARFNEEPQPNHEQILQAYHMLKNIEMSPSEFERVWDLAKPLANRLLDRPPSIHDLDLLQGAHPEEVHHYYFTHPHPEFPEVQAGEIARYHAAAEPIARQHGYEPNLHEVARFAIAGYDAEDMARHYGESEI